MVNKERIGRGGIMREDRRMRTEGDGIGIDIVMNLFAGFGMVLMLATLFFGSI